MNAIFIELTDGTVYLARTEPENATGELLTVQDNVILDLYKQLEEIKANANKPIEPKETPQDEALHIGGVMHWVAIVLDTYPKNKWLLITTHDKAHHVAYYSLQHKKWVANSKFGAEPKWWAELPEPPCA